MTKPKKPKLDQFHYHEFTDRVGCLTTMAFELLYEHPIFKSDAKIQEAFDEVTYALDALYTVAAVAEEENT